MAPRPGPRPRSLCRRQRIRPVDGNPRCGRLVRGNAKHPSSPSFPAPSPLSPSINIRGRYGSPPFYRSARERSLREQRMHVRQKRTKKRSKVSAYVCPDTHSPRRAPLSDTTPPLPSDPLRDTFAFFPCGLELSGGAIRCALSQGRNPPSV